MTSFGENLKKMDFCIPEKYLNVEEKKILLVNTIKIQKRKKFEKGNVQVYGVVPVKFTGTYVLSFSIALLNQLPLIEYSYGLSSYSPVACVFNATWLSFLPPYD